ncbi:MAG: carboxypeptidase-like regulatory domain-containing protein [archaeon]
MMTARKSSRNIESSLIFLFLFFLFVFVNAAPPSILGVITQFNGTPVDGVNVSVYNLTDGALISSNLSDANGTYYVDLSDAGDYYVIYNKSGFVYGADPYRNVSITLGGAENLSLNTSLYPDNHGSYNLTVYDLIGGVPLVDVNITVFASTGDVESKMTDASGNVLIQVIANNTDYSVVHNISLVKGGYKSQILTGRVVNEGFNVNDVVSLDSSRNVSGKVTRFSGDPISGMNVSVYNLSVGNIVASSLTDSAGNYFIDLSTWGSFFVIFNGSINGLDGFMYGDSNYRNITVTVGSVEAFILNTSLYLKGYGSYNFTVLDVWNSRPIPNANVTLFYSDTFNKTGFTDVSGNVLIEVVANTTSNAGVLHDISIAALGYNHTHLYSESILEGTNKNIYVNQTGTCEVRGHVFDSENNLIDPVISGAYIELWNYLNTIRAGWGGSYYYGAYTDSSGNYSINYPSTLAGTPNCNAYLKMSASGYISKDVLVASSTIKPVNLTGSAYVSGRVIDASNTSHAISGALVKIISGGSNMYQALTDSSGSFNMSVRGGVSHTIEVSFEGYAVYANSTAYSSSVDYGDIFLSGLGTLNGTLVDETNNSILLTGVNVTIAGGNVSYRTVTDSSGRFGMIVRDAIQYNVSFNLAGYFPDSELYAVSGVVDIGDFALRGKNRVHGVVSDLLNLHDKYIDGVKVELVSRMDSKKYTAYTDGSGVYSFYVSSQVNDYLMVFDKPGYNVSMANYSVVSDAEIDANLKGATHVEGMVTDAYSSIVPPLSNVLIEVTDAAGVVYYSTVSGFNGNYSLDTGVDFNYDIRVSLAGYQNKVIENLTWDQDRTGMGGTDRVQDIAMNGSVSIYVKTIDDFDNMNIDNSMVCVFYNMTSVSCLYIKSTGWGGATSFNIRGGESYRLKITRDGYIEQILPLNGGVLAGNFSDVIALEAYAELYLYDKYALNNEEIGDAHIELYTYNNKTDYNYYIDETRVNVSVVCNGLQRDDFNVTLVGVTNNYYSSLNTSSGSSIVYFRTVPVGTYILKVDGTSIGCGYYEESMIVGTGGVSYMNAYNTDTIPPVFFNLTESADPIELGSYVTVTIGAIDLQNMVDMVLIEVDGTNRTMARVLSDIYQYTWLPGAAGTEIYTIYANDTWGNINKTTANITVLDTVAPFVTLISPNGTPSYIENVTCEFNVTDLSPIQSCELWTDTGGVWKFNMTNDSVIVRSALNSITLNAIAEGSYLWNINCTDTSGNHNFSVANYSFIVDTSVPVLSIMSPENKSYNSGAIMLFNISGNKPLVGANYSLNGQPNESMFNLTMTNFYDLIFSMADGSYSVVFYGKAYNGRTGIAGPRVFTVDTVYPTAIDVSPVDPSYFVEPAVVSFEINASEPVNLTVVYWTNSTQWILTNASYVSNQNVFSPALANDSYSWNYTLCDPAGNCVSGGDFVFNVTPAPVSLIVYVNDTTGSLVGADDNGDGASVRLYNQTYTLTKNTTSSGYVVFSDLVDGYTYNISVNGTRQGYGFNGSVYGPIFGDSVTSLVVNITKLIVNVTDASFVPVGGASVTLYLSDNTTVAKNATGGNMTGVSDAGGIVIFNRALPCIDCNVTVTKFVGILVENSTRVNVVAGNSSNYAWVDPPQSMGNTFNLNFTLNSDIVPVNVTISIKDYNSTVIRWSNKTDSNGNAVIYNVPTGIYDFIVNGEDVGYGRMTYYANVVGVVIQNSGNTDVNGRAKIKVNGLLTYYVSVNANGYVQYDDLNEGIQRRGTYDDSVNSLGIKPMIRLGLGGNTTLSGYVYDMNFKQPMNLSYEPVSAATLKMYAKTSCDVIPSPTLLRYQTVTAGNGTYSLVVSPMMQENPSSYQDYCFNVSAVGLSVKYENDVDVSKNVNVGLLGDKVISGYVKVHNGSRPIFGASILLRSHQCYGGDMIYDNCEAYGGLTAADGSFSFDVNSRTGVLSYPPYTIRVIKTGYYILDNITISTLPTVNYNLSLVPAPLSFIRINVTSENNELISKNVSIKLVQNIASGGTFVIDKSDCDFYYNEYVCVVNRDNFSDYDLLVNGTAMGYDYYLESHIIPTETPVQRNVVLNITKVNITLFDESGVALSGINVTLKSLPSVTNVTVNGSVLFYKVLPGMYSLEFAGLLDYMSVFDSTIDVANIGAMNSKILYANETQFYVNISNGTAGLGNVSVGIGNLTNVTDASGEIYFLKVNYSLTGQYPVVFNRTDLYLRGYFAPDLSVDVQPGMDKDNGNNLSLVLNSTAGYGVFRVNTSVGGVNVSLWYNDTVYIDGQVSGDDGLAFLLANASVYNTSINVTAAKVGYDGVVLGPYNTSDGNITYVDVVMTAAYSNCGEGVISPVCYCGSNLYSSGYCCSGSYQVTACDGGSSGGGSSSSSSSSGLGIVIVPKGNGSVAEVYDLSLSAESYYILSISASGDSCVNVPVYVSNEGNTVLNNLNVELSGVPKFLEANYDSLLDMLYPGEERSIIVRICAIDSGVDDGDYVGMLSVFNDHVSKDLFVTLRVVHEVGVDVQSLRNRLDRLGSILDDIDVSLLTPELKVYYDLAQKNLKDAGGYIDGGDYDKAGYLLDEAEKNIQLLLEGIKVLGDVTETGVNWSFVSVAVIVLFAMGALMVYWFFLRNRTAYSKEPVLPGDLSAGAPFLRLPKIDLSNVKVPSMLLKVLGKHDVYYAHSVAKKRYIADVVEKVLELKCPECGGKIFQNRCVWCGYKFSDSLVKTRDDSFEVPLGTGSSSFSKNDAYYTHKSRRDGVGEKFVTDAFEHVVESVCPDCGGRIYKGKCVWCR